MAAAKKPDVRVTRDRIEVVFSTAVSKVKLLTREVGEEQPVDDLRWERQEGEGGTTYAWSARPDAPWHPESGSELKIEWAANGKRQEHIERVGEVAGAEEPAPADEAEQSGKRGHPCCDELANVFKVPLRVSSSVGGGEAAGQDMDTYLEGIVGGVFPRLPHRPDAAQFRESLGELVGGPAPASPYGGGAVAFAAPMRPAGGWPGGGSAAWGSPYGAAQPGGTMFAMTGGAPGSWPTGGYGASAYGASTNGATPLAMGQLTGPFAILASVANSLESDAVPAARDIGPLTQAADLDLIEAQRAIVVETLTTLIAELRQPAPDGPERLVLDDLTGRLSGSVDALGAAIGVSGTVVTPADFANVSRFQVLTQWGSTVVAVVGGFPFGAPDARAQMALVKQLLGVITEKAGELELELDAADFGPVERARFLVASTTTDDTKAGDEETDKISVARLLQWLQEQAGRHLPRLLDVSGTFAATTVVATLQQQEGFVDRLTTLNGPDDFPWTYPIVDRLVGDLDRYLEEAIEAAGALTTPAK